MRLLLIRGTVVMSLLSTVSKDGDSECAFVLRFASFLLVASIEDFRDTDADADRLRERNPPDEDVCDRSDEFGKDKRVV